MDLAEIVCTRLNRIVQWRTSMKKIMNFLVIFSWPVEKLFRVSCQHDVFMVMWALLSVFMFHNIFCSEDNCLLGRYGVEFSRQLPTFPKNVLPASSGQLKPFFPEHGDSMILRNVDTYQTNYRTSRPRYSDCRENRRMSQFLNYASC